MKIALVSPYDFAYPGGVNNHITALERCLINMGHEVKIIAPSKKLDHNSSRKLIPIGQPRPVPVRGTTIRISTSLRLASKIKEVLNKEKFDIVHLHEPFMPMLCSAVLRFSDTVNIGTFHATEGSPGYRWAWPISKILLSKRSRKLNGRIAVSQAAMDYVCKYVPGDYTIIPNGIDLSHFSSDTPYIERFCDGKINILFVGRLEKRKGLNYLLSAYQQVKQDFPNSRLIVVGPGTRLRNKLVKQVNGCSLKDVVFTGHISYKELPSYYKTADIFCAPATGQESFGIILLEAMALGKPIVATHIKGYAGVVNHGKEGFLVSPKDAKALSRALSDLMADERLRREMGSRGTITAQNYDWRNVAIKVFDFYSKILKESSYRQN
jgi:phosphatidylinositol alpha-mannosyltransferase